MLPTLHTARLVLCPFTLDDAPAVQALAGDADVARTTMNIPHPYPDGAAEVWISRHQLDFLEHRHLTLSLRRDGQLVGAIGLALEMSHVRAEMGYWIGRPFWGNGYCTEAARAILRYGFETLHLERIFARHMTHNPASGRVMQKIGMQHEGILRQHLLKDGQRLDIAVYGILSAECASEPG